MRKTKFLAVPLVPATRDSGKLFQLTEMSADAAERWAFRALFAITRNGVDVPDDLQSMGMGALVAFGVRGLLTMGFADAAPLLDEMMACVEIVPDPSKRDVVRPIDPEDVEEVQTRLWLRDQVWELHTGFTIAGFLSTLGQSATNQTPATSGTPMSQEPSGTSSPAA